METILFGGNRFNILYSWRGFSAACNARGPFVGQAQWWIINTNVPKVFYSWVTIESLRKSNLWPTNRPDPSMGHLHCGNNVYFVYLFWWQCRGSLADRIIVSQTRASYIEPIPITSQRRSRTPREPAWLSVSGYEEKILYSEHIHQNHEAATIA